MTLAHILIFGFGGLFYAAFVPGRWRGWLLLLVSAVAIFALQPSSPVRFVDFILPSVTVGLAVFVWLATQPEAMTRENVAALLLVGGVIVGMSLMRYVHPDWRLTPSRPPETWQVALAVVIVGGLLLALKRMNLRGLVASGIFILIVLFAILKTPAFADALSRFARVQTGEEVRLASGATDLAWLGFSYVAFRLLHILLDKREGRLPPVSLRAHLTYTLFFPAYTAGPIDRIERHLKDDEALPTDDLAAPNRLLEAGGRIVVGIFKKFVIADSLALFALNEINAAQATSAVGLWLLLYAYGLRLFFDFSGYSDIAIGLARLYGVQLPENFDRPYLRQNIAAFWQSWHMTLSQWARLYVFSPLSRALLLREPKPSPLLVVLGAQMVTMLVIGLWHGVSWNFLLWGVWHGIGLFIHKVWSDRTRTWYLSLKTRPRLKAVWTAVGIVITFHFVTLGWVWFALPDLDAAWAVLRGLFGG